MGGKGEEIAKDQHRILDEGRGPGGYSASKLGRIQQGPENRGRLRLRQSYSSPPRTHPRSRVRRRRIARNPGNCNGLELHRRESGELQHAHEARSRRRIPRRRYEPRQKARGTILDRVDTGDSAPFQCRDDVAGLQHAWPVRTGRRHGRTLLRPCRRSDLIPRDVPRRHGIHAKGPD